MSFCFLHKINLHNRYIMDGILDSFPKTLNFSNRRILVIKQYETRFFSITEIQL